MRKLGLALAFLLCLPAAAPARDAFHFIRDSSPPGPPPGVPLWGDLSGPGVPRAPSRAEAGMDTTFLGFWDFDAGGTCDPQGWISVDRTAQLGDFFHVDDFAGLGGGDFGRLAPLEGAQSLWCGAAPDPDNEYLCGYAALPGYGNDWNQSFCTASCLSVTGDAFLDFLITWDSEPGYDYTYVEYDACDDQWVEQFAYDGIGNGFASHIVPDSLHTGNLRFRFRFLSDGAWSDQDNLWDTDGAVVIDSLTVRDASGVVVPTELFEVESAGAIDAASGNWVTCTMPGYGDFAGLFPGNSVVQEDPCASELDCIWGFFKGSTYDYACGGWPQQKAVPYENERGQYIHNEIWSPPIPIIGTGPVFELRFDVYRDLTLNALVIYVWHIRSVVDDCAGRWRDPGFFYWPGGKDWLRATFGVSQFVDPAATHLQIALGARDLCPFWGGIYGACLCHSHAPLFDDVELYRMEESGPAFQVRDLDLFQDTFSADGTITGTARADAANDILPSASAGILPGDSVSVTVTAVTNGVDFHAPGDSASGPAVYCFVSIDGPHAGVNGAALVDDPRYHAVGTQVVGGRTWTQIQMDSSRTSGGSLVPDDYNVDLNDNLFVPGDTVWFFFGARSAPPSNKWSYVTQNENSANWDWRCWQTNDIAEAAALADEFTILPAAGWRRGGDILYVDGMNLRGAQPYFDWAFRSLGIFGLVDRYDIRGPSSAVGNHPGGRVVDAGQQLVGVYRKMIWDCGDLVTAFGDGSGTPDKSDDAGMLYQFLDGLSLTGGVYLCGDDVADEWMHTLGYGSDSATLLRTTFMDFDVVTGWHVSTLGVSPYAVGEPAGFFGDGYGVDTMIVYGGCPLINDFDVVAPLGAASLQMTYRGQGATGGAVVGQVTANGQGVNVGFVLSGFSFIYIRDAGASGIPVRHEHMYRILNWLGNLTNPPTNADVPVAYRNELGQNRPNPFNPTTTIEYSIAESGYVTLRVYNVAGQLVRTLVDEHQSPERVAPVTWDGTNDVGHEVSSGVYFYRIVTKGFTQTRKMVILK